MHDQAVTGRGVLNETVAKRMVSGKPRGEDNYRRGDDLVPKRSSTTTQSNGSHRTAPPRSSSINAPRTSSRTCNLATVPAASICTRSPSRGSSLSTGMTLLPIAEPLSLRPVEALVRSPTEVPALRTRPETRVATRLRCCVAPCPRSRPRCGPGRRGCVLMPATCLRAGPRRPVG